MTRVDVCNYGRVVQSYQSDKHISLIVGKLQPFAYSYDSVNKVLTLHMTREQYALPDLPTLNVGVKDRYTITP